MTQLLPHDHVELKEIAHYSIISCIGRGGMGLVYRARDTRLDRQVAIKCLRTELFEARYRERFKREALLLAKLNHPNIVQIYDYQETENQLALVMEYVEGQNLQQHLREHIVPLTQRMQWLGQIAQGLAVAHDAGIIHRDLKAENILINQHKLAKITDLGIAKSQDLNATLTDHVTGSYGSMSPEQAMGEELDNRSDLFSFGILAYQLLCGVHPFGDTQNKLQLMQRIISHPPIPPTKTNPDLPPEVVEFLGQLLSKNPDNRPSNTHWVAAQCERLYQLISLNSGADLDTTQILSHAHTSHSGIRNSKHSQDTFETRFHKNKSTFMQDVKNYVRNNAITVALIGLAVMMVAGAIIWQLQPGQPKYVAVLKPRLTTDGMQESQQELMRSAVYDAIQQSVLQLDGYYLIPQNEINDIHAEENNQGIEAVRKATAADEIISASIQCKIESCTISLSRLSPDSTPANRLRVQDTKTVDVLTDNYLSVAEVVQRNVDSLYAKAFNNALSAISEDDYLKFLAINLEYQKTGASQELLNKIHSLSVAAQKLPLTQTLYTDIGLDLYNLNKDQSLLAKIAGFIDQGKNSSHYLLNLFYIKIAEKDFDAATAAIEKIKNERSNPSHISELESYKLLAQKEYAKSINSYQKLIKIKPTTNNYYYLALTYWHSGDTESAKKYIKESLLLSPDSYKSHSLYGAASLLSGDLDVAEKSFLHIYDINKNDTQNLNNLGISYLLKAEYNKAIEIFTYAETLKDSDRSYLLLNKADAQDLAGDKAAATKTYETLIALANEKKIDANLQHLAQAHAHIGNYSQALTYLQDIERLFPQNLNAYYTGALIHSLSNNQRSALLNIDKSLKNGMNIIWFRLAWFDRLCSEKEFVALMNQYGEHKRCALPL